MTKYWWRVPCWEHSMSGFRYGHSPEKPMFSRSASCKFSENSEIDSEIQLLKMSINASWNLHNICIITNNFYFVYMKWCLVFFFLVTRILLYSQQGTALVYICNTWQFKDSCDVILIKIFFTVWCKIVCIRLFWLLCKVVSIDVVLDLTYNWHLQTCNNFGATVIGKKIVDTM